MADEQMDIVEVNENKNYLFLLSFEFLSHILDGRRDG